MDDWKMKTAYTSQSSTVNKFLREGFEPFWGYRCSRRNKQGVMKEDVKMYFRKAPEPVVTELEMLESEPPVVQVDMNNVSEFIQQLNMVLRDLPKRIAEELNKFSSLPMRAGGKLDVMYGDEVSPEAAERFTEEIFGDNEDEPDPLEELNEQREIVRDEAAESSLPAGDNIRIVDDAPDLPKREITNKQQAALDTLRNTSDTNITVFPVDDAGNIRVFMGGKIYTVFRNGELEEQDNPAKTSSLAEGV